MVLNATLLNTQDYKVRIKSKVEQPRERKCPPIHLGVVAIEKGAFGLSSTQVANFTIYSSLVYIYIYIYIYIMIYTCNCGCVCMIHRF